jgi:hypothetical protein
VVSLQQAASDAEQVVVVLVDQPGIDAVVGDQAQPAVVANGG